MFLGDPLVPSVILSEHERSAKRGSEGESKDPEDVNEAILRQGVLVRDDSAQEFLRDKVNLSEKARSQQLEASS